MKVLAKCPQCGAVLRLDAADADKRVRCPHCRGRFKVPDLRSLDKAVRIVQAADAPVFVDEDGGLFA